LGRIEIAYKICYDTQKYWLKIVREAKIGRRAKRIFLPSTVFYMLYRGSLQCSRI
jgi:hypothetical protein